MTRLSDAPGWNAGLLIGVEDALCHRRRIDYRRMVRRRLDRQIMRFLSSESIVSAVGGGILTREVEE
jgi:hypothetical protein